MVLAHEASSTVSIQRLPIDRIVLPPQRHYFGRDRLEELAKFMLAYGLIEPIKVRPVDEGYELVKGTRRYLAAQLLGWRTIDAVVV